MTLYEATQYASSLLEQMGKLAKFWEIGISQDSVRNPLTGNPETYFAGFIRRKSTGPGIPLQGRVTIRSHTDGVYLWLERMEGGNVTKVTFVGETPLDVWQKYRRHETDYYKLWQLYHETLDREEAE